MVRPQAIKLDATLFIGAGIPHISPIYCGFVPEADAAVAMIGRWIGARIAEE